jgi:hypothetical protein
MENAREILGGGGRLGRPFEAGRRHASALGEALLELGVGDERIVGSHAGIAIGEDGYSQMGLEAWPACGPCRTFRSSSPPTSWRRSESGPTGSTACATARRRDAASLRGPDRACGDGGGPFDLRRSGPRGGRGARRTRPPSAFGDHRLRRVRRPPRSPCETRPRSARHRPQREQIPRSLIARPMTISGTWTTLQARPWARHGVA